MSREPDPSFFAIGDEEDEDMPAWPSLEEILPDSQLGQEGEEGDLQRSLTFTLSTDVLDLQIEEDEEEELVVERRHPPPPSFTPEIPPQLLKEEQQQEEEPGGWLSAYASLVTDGYQKLSESVAGQEPRAVLARVSETLAEKVQTFSEGPKGRVFCSWCLRYQRQGKRVLMEEEGMFARGHWTCECGQPTQQCMLCAGMAKEGSKLCVRCDGTIEEAQVIHGDDTEDTPFSAESWSVEWARSSLERRSSPQAERCYREGLIRPFLMLASMRGELRARISKILGLGPEVGWGESHQEAAHLLMATAAGIQSRVVGLWESMIITLSALQGPTTWYHILRALLREDAALPALNEEQARQACLSQMPLVSRMENELIGCLGKYCATNQLLNDGEPHADVAQRVALAQSVMGVATGSPEMAYVRRVVEQVLMPELARRAPPGAQFRSPAEFILADQQSALEPVLNCVVIMLNHRIVLAMHGVDLNQYVKPNAGGD